MRKPSPEPRCNGQALRSSCESQRNASRSLSEPQHRSTPCHSLSTLQSEYSEQADTFLHDCRGTPFFALHTGHCRKNYIVLVSWLLSTCPRVNKFRRTRNIYGDEHYFFSVPAAYSMNGNFLCKPDNEATFPTASISILLEDMTIQQGRFDLGKSQFLCLAFNLRMVAIHILIVADFLFDLVDVHTLISSLPSEKVQGQDNPSSKAFASFRSAVSNPSVNQP